jgi:selenocysteine lyase/cysteine desulfurase
MDDAARESSRREFLAGASACALLAPALGIAAGEAVPETWKGLARRPADDGLWRAVASEYFIEPGLVYLNSGTYGPTLRAACEAACRHLREMGANYNQAFREHMMGDAVPRFVAHLARFLGAGPDEVALTSGTTEAMNYIANGLDFSPGDEIVTTKHEHLGGIYPWLLQARRRGAVVRQIDLATPPASTGAILDAFGRALGPRTRVLSFCHVQYTDGAILPVRELCAMARERGIVTVVDGAQAVGMLDFRIRDLGCDFYAASFHKWLTSPYGCGLLYVREAMRERLWPTVVLSFSGWNPTDRDGHPGVTDISYAPNYPQALLKYSSNIEYYGALWWTVALAMDFQDAIGRDRVEARIRALATRMLEGLRAIPGLALHTPEDPALRAGLVSFRAGRADTEQFFYALRQQFNIVGRYIRHPGMGFDVNRFSTHIFNSPEQVDAAVAAVRALAASRSQA